MPGRDLAAAVTRTPIPSVPILEECTLKTGGTFAHLEECTLKPGGMSDFGLSNLFYKFLYFIYDVFNIVRMAFSTKDRHRLQKKSLGMVLRRSCAVFWILGEEMADFLTWWILEKTRKWRPKDGGVVVGRAEFSQVSCVLRVCQLCKCSCPDEIRLVMAEAPGDRIQEYQASCDDSCLNLTKLDWTRPDQEYQASSDDSCLNLTKLDWTRSDQSTPEDSTRISGCAPVQTPTVRRPNAPVMGYHSLSCPGGRDRSGKPLRVRGARRLFTPTNLIWTLLRNWYIPHKIGHSSRFERTLLQVSGRSSSFERVGEISNHAEKCTDFGGMYAQTWRNVRSPGGVYAQTWRNVRFCEECTNFGAMSRLDWSGCCFGSALHWFPSRKRSSPFRTVVAFPNGRRLSERSSPFRTVVAFMNGRRLYERSSPL
ncbi:hypothetical protein Bbelb_197460 [Branchiostoma belcheri]|nr:hypothetical protein Bbelb_197460 [Branchiostoma belcheri]